MDERRDGGPGGGIAPRWHRSTRAITPHSWSTKRAIVAEFGTARLALPADGRGSALPGDESADAHERLAELVLGGRVAGPDVALAGWTERSTGTTATCSSARSRSAKVSESSPVEVILGKA